MPGFLSAAQQGRAPFELNISLNVCKCATYPQVLYTARQIDRLIGPAQGYWALLVGFWGDHPNITVLSIVDVRDGMIMWRNGRLLKRENEDGTKQDAGRDQRSSPRRVGRDSGVGPAGEPRGRGRGNHTG